MKGKHNVIVQNNRLHYEFEIKRNITNYTWGQRYWKDNPG